MYRRLSLVLGYKFLQDLKRYSTIWVPLFRLLFRLLAFQHFYCLHNSIFSLNTVIIKKVESCPPCSFWVNSPNNSTQNLLYQRERKDWEYLLMTKILPIFYVTLLLLASYNTSVSSTSSTPNSSSCLPEGGKKRKPNLSTHVQQF